MPEQFKIGARNPRALVEAVIGRPVDWSQVTDERQFTAEVLATPYEELFDPRNESPVFLGLEVDAENKVVEVAPRFLAHAVDAADRRSDLERKPSVDFADVRTVADLKTLTGVSLEDVPIRSVIPSQAGGWHVELGQAPSVRRAAMATKFTTSVVDALWTDILVFTLGWTPAGGEWSDVGSFFKEAAEYFDPVQSNLADCWLVSAMSSVAWSLPFSVSQRTRATGTNDQSFVNLIELTEPSTGVVSRYEMTDQTLVYSGTTSPMYTHSLEDGELWPQIIEKAFANLRASTNLDHPDLRSLNYGDCVYASAVLTGRQPHYTGTASSSTTDLINLVKAHSVDHRTVNPMTCWTYGTGADSPDHVDYSSANVVANHCYSVLGWVHGSQLVRTQFEQQIDVTLPPLVRGGGLTLDPSITLPFLGRDYIVLRNPWGYFEPTVGELAGLVQMKDVSFWRSIDLDVNDGVFAIDVPTFKKYFAGIGVAL